MTDLTDPAERIGSSLLPPIAGPTLAQTVEETLSAAVDALPRHHGEVGRYVLLKIIGQGGMGLVWEAYDPVLDRKIALKLLAAPVAPGDVVSEAQAMARLSHPNVVTVHDAGIEAVGDYQLAYVAMELVSGRTLRHWLDDPGHSLDEKLDLFMLAGRGLVAAHAAQLIHRDFKPSNVLLGEDGRVRVSDFGLAVERSDVQRSAQAGEEPAPATTQSARAGTPRYMAPEQTLGLQPDAPADQFAFCVALHEAIWGVHPFAEGEQEASWQPRTYAPRMPAPAPRSRLEARLLPIVARGLAVRPADRWPSMAEMLTALQTARGRLHRRPLVIAAAATLLAVVGVLSWRGGATPPPSVCAHATDSLTLAWGPRQRQILGAAFARLEGGLGSAAWPAVGATLDDWADRWRTLRVEQCEADRNGARPSPSLDARHACLDRRLGELSGLVRALAVPDLTVVVYALSAAHALAPPESCMSALPSIETKSAALPFGAEVNSVRASIDHARALRNLGKERPGLEESKIAAAEADRIAWAPLTAEAQLGLGQAEQALTATPPAIEAFHRALRSAEVIRDDRQRFDASMGLFKSSLDASDFVDAGRWLQLAQAIAQHLPDDHWVGLRLALGDEQLALYSARYHDCVRLGDQALALSERVAPGSPTHVAVLRNLGRCHGELEEYGEAYALLTRALALSERINGHDAPQPAVVLIDLGVVERHLEHYDEALAHYQDALAIRERIDGPTQPDCASIHNNIANVLKDLKRYDEAMPHLERALAIWYATEGRDHPDVANTLSIMGRIAMEQSHPEKAEPLFRRALEIRRAKLTPGQHRITDALENVGEALLAQRKPECVQLFESVLAARELDPDSSPADKAVARFTLARARVELGVQREGALELAVAACKELDTSQRKDGLTECRAWLAARGH